VFMNGQADARLVRADPDMVPADAGLAARAVNRGRGVFAEHCATCHGAGGKAAPGQGVPNLADSDWLFGAGQVSDIERIVDHGIRAFAPGTWNLAEMPAFARAVPSATEKLTPLSPGDIRDVAEYLISLSGRRAESDSAVRGKVIYQGQGGCYDCHAPDAKGDGAIGAPNLTDDIWLYGDGGREAIFNSIARGHAGFCPAFFGRLSAADIRSVAVYVYSLSHPQESRGQRP
jgi:cytochrome c oxidase cbb3-type subunit III